MSKENAALKYTCVFGGGGARGVSYAGIVKAMEELGIKPATIAGSSVGAIFAGLVAVGYTAQELKDIFMHTNFDLFKDIHFGFGKDFALSKGEVFLDWARDLIEKKYYGDCYKKGECSPVTFADIDKNLVIITTDLTNFKYKEFSKFETPDFEIAYAIRISSTMPGLMKPVWFENELLVDGDLQKSWPLWKLSKNLYPEDERILEFRLEGDYEEQGQNAIDFINAVYSCMTSLATDFVIETYGDKDKFDYIKINTGSVVVVDFNQSKEKRKALMDIGYNQTMDYFNNILIDKKKERVKDYRTLSKHLIKLENYICANKIKQAEHQLGVLYIDLNEIEKNIDYKFSIMIKEFKDNFRANLRPASLFGVYSLKNHSLLKSQIKVINSQLEERIIELEKYVFNL